MIARVAVILALVLAAIATPARGADDAAPAPATAPTPLPDPGGRMEPAPKELQDIGIDEKSGATLPLDLQFVDETGKTVALRKYFNNKRPVILQLSYFGCPSLCSLVSNGLVDSLNELTLTMGRDYDVINVSFDPAETARLAKLKKQSFLDAYNHPAGAEAWHFLTGNPKEIEQLTRAVGFRYKWVESSKQFSHPAVLILLTPDGKVSRYLYGVQFPSRTLRLSLVEASEGKIGTTVDRFLLTCFHYDSYAGKYTPVAMGIMRVGGVITVLVIAVVITVLIRREHKRERRNKAQEMKLSPAC
jgi:protein SCO1